MRYLTVDIGTNAVKSLLVEVSDRQTSVIKHAHVTLDRSSSSRIEDGMIVEAVRSAVKGMKGKVIIASIPRSMVVVRDVANLPRARDEANLRSAVEMQVAPDMPFPMEKAIGDIQNVVESEGRLSLQFVAARRDDVERYMSILEEADVKPDMLIPSAFATALAAGKAVDEEVSQSPVLFLDIGAGRTDMGIILAGRLAFSRSFPVGGDTLTASIARTFGVDFGEAERIKHQEAYLPSSDLSLPGETEGSEPEDEGDERRRLILDTARKWASRLALEVERSIQAFLSGMIGETRISPSKLLLCGGGARLRGLEGYLRERLNIDVVRWNPMGAIPGGEKVAEADGDLFALPVGLARMAIDGVKLASLIPPEERERRERKRFLTKAISYAAAVVLGIALLGTGLTLWDNHVDGMLADINSQLLKMQKTSQQSRSMLLKNLAMLDLMKPKVSPLDVLRELSLMFPDRTKIAFTNLQIDKNGKVTISVEASSHDAISEAIRKIDRSLLFEDVKQGQIASVEKNKRPILQVQISFKISPKANEIIAGSSGAGESQVAEAGR